jgi:hypothetical protein
MHSKVNDGRPVSIYNADKKELMAIFSLQSIAGKYIYEDCVTDKRGKIHNHLMHKSRITKSRFNFNIAVRYSTEEQIKILGVEDHKIFGEYPKMHITKIKGFTSTAQTMMKEFKERNNRRNLELKNKNK